MYVSANQTSKNQIKRAPAPDDAGACQSRCNCRRRPRVCLRGQLQRLPAPKPVFQCQPSDASASASADEAAAAAAPARSGGSSFEARSGIASSRPTTGRGLTDCLCVFTYRTVGIAGGSGGAVRVENEFYRLAFVIGDTSLGGHTYLSELCLLPGRTNYPKPNTKNSAPDDLRSYICTLFTPGT